MPIVHVHIRAGRPAAQRKAILDGVHAALVDAFRVPESDRNQILHEHAPEHLESPKGPEYTLVELTVFPGRSADAKRRLYEGIVRNLEHAPGIPPSAVMIVLHEPPLECWGIRGGKIASDVAIGFKVDV
ncbi:tautomerase family protein [Anaeromyxobacter oryzae]|uniref:Tautomerase n=1 Tax=Anaeromyxobacter oryzae TaxID=2918170 RepID=A0ABM7WRQ4_9BACT|nr:tautomerase family protein [Anaeromyxobacter oryzae]BDG02152.1 tautomerase [Anaeromyxobacter oryzae]